MPYLKEFALQTDVEEAYNITNALTDSIRESGVAEGIALIYCPHTTAGITITENTDPDVTQDMLLGLNRSFPDYTDYKHGEGNSHAHVKSSMMGCEITVIVSGGRPLLGLWQAVYFVEFDGARHRKYFIKIFDC